MDIHDEIAADFATILAEFGKSVLFQGQVMMAMISEPMTTHELDLGGEVNDVRFMAKVLRSSLPSMPHSGQVLRWDEHDYRIRGVMNRPPHAIVTLELGAADP